MIKFFDLNEINKKYLKSFTDDINDIVTSGHLILGSYVKKFEDEFSKYCGSRHFVGVGSGLDAITLMLEGLNIQGKLKKGQRIIVPANTHFASVMGIVKAGFKPCLVDPNEDTLNIDVECVRRAIASETCAILAVHLYGQVCEMEGLRSLAKENNLLLLDDCSHAHGVQNNKDVYAGNFCHASAFSFYPTKNLGALGDGGGISTNDPELASIVMMLRNYGTVKKDELNYIGINSRLDEIQAAFLIRKLTGLDRENQRRREIGKFYLENIRSRHVKTTDVSDLRSHVFHQFIIRVRQRSAFRSYLQSKGIETMIHYPISPHRQRAFSKLKFEPLPVTEQLETEILSIPIGPYLDYEAVQYITSMINSFKP